MLCRDVGSVSISESCLLALALTSWRLGMWRLQGTSVDGTHGCACEMILISGKLLEFGKFANRRLPKQGKGWFCTHANLYRRKISPRTRTTQPTRTFRWQGYPLPPCYFSWFWYSFSGMWLPIRSYGKGTGIVIPIIQTQLWEWEVNRESSYEKNICRREPVIFFLRISSEADSEKVFARIFDEFLRCSGLPKTSVL